MKFILSLLSLLLITKECDSVKTNAADLDFNNSKQTELVIKSELQESDTIVSYTAETRGSYQNVSVSKEVISVSNSRNNDATKTYTCSKQDWDEVVTLLSKINLTKINNLKAPSTKSYSDAAMAATLKLTIDGKEITTPSFDHGNPPEAILALVNKVLSIKENALKQ
jgi:heat shock protein HslJ